MKKTLLIGVALFAGICATAQNLNPTVEVTNTYVREATGIDKPVQKMEVPDSVMRFNLDFDYSVRSTPYMGSYEFKPYFVQLRPQARPSTEGKLFVRLGAGYTLRPEATVVWSPIQKGKFRLNLYADHESFFGQFKGIGLQDNQLVDSGNRVKGNQMRTQVGADALFGWNSGRLTAGVAYKNIGAHVGERGPFPHHFFLANARIQSLPNTKFSYSLGTKVSLMGGYLAENHSFTDGHIGGNFGIHHVWLGASFEHVSTDGKFGGDVAVSPHYLLEVGRFHMDLGVKLSFALNNQNPDFYPTKAGYVFPDAYVSFDAVPDALVLFTSATGGHHMNVYSDYLDTKPFMAVVQGVWDTSVERVNLNLGLRGSVAGRFSYDVRGGWVWWQNAFLYGYDYNACIFDYIKFMNQFYLKADLAWSTSFMELGAKVDVRHSILKDDEDNSTIDRLLAPPVFTGQFRALYKWGGRLRAGVTLDARTASVGTQMTMPGFADLGLLAEFDMSSRVGLWLKAGNLLNATIQRVPGFAMHGPWFTIGATFNL